MLQSKQNKTKQNKTNTFVVLSVLFVFVICYFVIYESINQSINLKTKLERVGSIFFLFGFACNGPPTGSQQNH